MSRAPGRSLAVVAAAITVACVSGTSSGTYRGDDPFADAGRRDPPPGRPSLRVAFEGHCDVCSVTLDLAGEVRSWTDTAVISRRLSVTPGVGTITMSAVPVPGRGPVSRIAIRIDGDVVSEASSDEPDAVTTSPSSGALYITAEVPRD